MRKLQQRKQFSQQKKLGGVIHYITTSVVFFENSLEIIVFDVADIFIFFLID